ncbi:hypothetical protein LR48_Vigan743s000200 [Vigna angularis]|uniref:Uncharacterized protein n=1 Tax=Phaseolus angularis TaxID=3914 RepID=A0A0L9THN4_PHAAN|nr:hypothetical protein LR48_Vigan743s000200 [Vigna angularis]
MIIPKDFPTVIKVGHYRRLLPFGITQRIYRRLMAVGICIHLIKYEFGISLFHFPKYFPGKLLPNFHSRPRFPLSPALISTSLCRSQSETIIAIDSEPIELVFLYDGGLAASGGVVAASGLLSRRGQSLVPARLPTTTAGSTSSVGPLPTPTVQPPTPAVDPTPTPSVDPTPTPVVHPSTTPTTDPLPPPVIITPTPPPVVMSPTPDPDPTSIPSSSVIPPSNTVRPSADQDSSGDGEGLDPPLHDRPWIEPYGKGFIPSRVASQAITRSIKQQFLSPWPTWGAIPDDDKKPFWQRFQMKVQWKPKHESQIHRNFHMKASHRMSEMFRDARNAGQHPYWLGEIIWNSLLAHWNTVEFRNKCAKAQRNRASERGGTLYTSGSITIHEHAIRMAQALGRAVHVDEVFAQTHVRKGTNQFVDERSRKTHEEFSTRLSQVRSEHESAPTPDDANNAEDDIHSSGDGEGLDPPLHDRPWIEPYGKGFIPSRVASQAITRSIKQQFLSPWPTWGAIPDDDKKPFWQRFQEEFSTRLSQVRSEHESAPTPDDANNAEDDIPSRGGTLKHQPSSSTTTPDEVVLCFTQALQQRDQEITDLRAEFTNFKALVMRVFPATSQDELVIPPTQPQPSLSPAVPQ